ncbi:MAG: hypothetical protein FWG87_08710 [Defluviitaleaceae bacterium]|nr:hypothetical protein [Defluviitaleaceae bacterium]
MPKTVKTNKSSNMIKILVSTNETQGQRESDFCFVPENEPVHRGVNTDKENTSDNFNNVGCLIGLYCTKGTTTIKVASVEMTKEQYIDGFVNNLRCSNSSKAEIEKIKKEAKLMLKVAAIYEVGSVLEYMFGGFGLRKGKETYQYGNSGGNIMLLTQRTKDNKNWITISDAGGISIFDFNHWDDDGSIARDYLDCVVEDFGEYNFRKAMPREIRAKIEKSQYKDEVYQSIDNFLMERNFVTTIRCEE